MSSTPSPHDDRGRQLQGPSPEQVADLRRRLDGYEKNSRRLEVPTAVALIVLGTVIAAGVSARPAVGAVGFWVGLLGVLLLWARSVRNRTERGAGPRGPAPHITDHGEPATVILAPRARLAVTLAFWLLIAVPLLGAGLAAALAGQVGAGVLLAVVGAWSLVPVFLVAAGQITPGGVWMTAAAVVVRDHGLESRIPWEALVTVAPSEAGTVVLRAAVSDTIHRRRSGPWAVGARIGGPDLASVDTRWLAIDAPAIARILEHYRQRGAAAELGTPASLTTIAGLSRG